VQYFCGCRRSLYSTAFFSASVHVRVCVCVKVRVVFPYVAAVSFQIDVDMWTGGIVCHLRLRILVCLSCDMPYYDACSPLFIDFGFCLLLF
jgi:hypothetical protein